MRHLFGIQLETDAPYRCLIRETELKIIFYGVGFGH